MGGIASCYCGNSPCVHDMTEEYRSPEVPFSTLCKNLKCRSPRAARVDHTYKPGAAGPACKSWQDLGIKPCYCGDSSCYHGMCKNPTCDSHRVHHMYEDRKSHNKGPAS